MPSLNEKRMTNSCACLKYRFLGIFNHFDIVGCGSDLRIEVFAAFPGSSDTFGRGSTVRYSGGGRALLWGQPGCSMSLLEDAEESPWFDLGAVRNDLAVK